MVAGASSSSSATSLFIKSLVCLGTLKLGWGRVCTVVRAS